MLQDILMVFRDNADEVQLCDTNRPCVNYVARWRSIPIMLWWILVIRGAVLTYWPASQLYLVSLIPLFPFPSQFWKGYELSLENVMNEYTGEYSWKTMKNTPGKPGFFFDKFECPFLSYFSSSQSTSSLSIVVDGWGNWFAPKNTIVLFGHSSLV